MMRFCRLETFFFLGSWLFLMLAGKSNFLNDPGTYWSTATGELLLSTRQFPAQDPFSCSRQGLPWVPTGVYGAVVLATLHRIGGLDALLLGAAVVLAAVYTCIAHRLLRAGFHWLFALTAIALFHHASNYHYHARPHLATMLLMAWLYLLLVDFDAGRSSIATLLWLPPVMAVWISVHAGGLGGIGTVGLAVGLWSLAWLVGFNSPVQSYRQLAFLWLIVVSCVLAAFVNPYGAALPNSYVQLMRSTTVPEFMEEHWPIYRGISQPHRLKWLVGVGVVAVIYLLALADAGWRRIRVTWLLPLVWLFLAVQRVRNGPLFALTALLGLAEVLPHTRLAAWLRQQDSFLYRPPSQPPPRLSWRNRCQQLVIPLLLVCGVLCLQAAGVHAGPFGHGWARLNKDHWPVTLLPQLQAYERENPGKGVLNDMIYGGFLIFHTPELKVFIDDRCELYDDGLLRAYSEEYVRAPGHDPRRIDEWVRAYDLRLALVDRGQPLDQFLSNSKAWRKVGETESAVLYERP